MPEAIPHFDYDEDQHTHKAATFLPCNIKDNGMTHFAEFVRHHRVRLQSIRSYWIAATVPILLASLVTCTLYAQQENALPAPNSEHSGALSVKDVCAASASRSGVTSAYQWMPGGKSVTYIKLIQEDMRVRQVLLDGVAATGEQRVLMTAQQIDAIFPPKQVRMEEGQQPSAPEMRDFEWSPNGRGILLFSATGLGWFDPATKQARSLVSGKAAINDARISPDGHWVSFLRDHDLWIVSAAGGEPRPITRGGSETLLKGELDWLYPAELGAKTAYWWSPDSSSIAYLEFDLKGVARYSPPFHLEEDGDVGSIDYPKPGGTNPSVHVFAARVTGNGAPVLIDTGTDDTYLPRVTWLPDSRRIAIERLNRKQTTLDLLLADAHTGTAKTLLSDSDPYWINIGEGPYFLEHSPQFLWSSERSGYRHLYLYGLDGKLVTPVTHGDWEVTSLAAVSEQEKKLYFIATEKSSTERHLYSVSMDGSGLKRISNDAGTHEVSFSKDTSAYLDTYSTAITSPTHAIFSAAGVKILSLDTSEAKLQLSPVEFLTVKMHDGIDLNAMMIKPAGFSAARKYPVIVYVYGGPGGQAVHDAWDGDVSMWHQLLAQKGYIVFAIDNRGTSGRGHLFEEYIHLLFGGEEMSDQHDGVRYLKSLPYVDASRIGIWGKGFGGALTVQALLHPPLTYKAGFAVAPVVDWLRYDSAFAERYLGDPEKNQDGYLASSPLENAKRLKDPLLVIQGTDDLQVHPDQAVELSHELLEVGKYAEVSLFPGEGHAIDHADACAVMYRRATDFFSNNLR